MVRKLKNIEKTKEFNENTKLLRKGTQIVECIMKDENECLGKIVEAHSIQNNRFLKKISRNGYVYYFDTGMNDDNQLISTFEEKGRKVFSTFKGFCQKHDKQLFQPIEDKEYTGSNEQDFLFAFRAFAKGLHSKKQIVLCYKNLLNKLLNENISENRLYDFRVFEIRNRLKNEEINLALLTDELKIFKTGIKEKVFNSIYTYKIILEKEYPIVCNSLFLPYRDVNFNFIFNQEQYHKIQIGELNPNIYLNIFPENDKTYILISCLEKNKDILKNFFKNLIDKENIKHKISTLVLTHSENTGFSPEYIDNYFNEEEIEEINNIFMENVPNILYTSKTQINLFRDIPIKNNQ